MSGSYIIKSPYQTGEVQMIYVSPTRRKRLTLSEFVIYRLDKILKLILKDVKRKKIKLTHYSCDENQILIKIQSI